MLSTPALKSLIILIGFFSLMNLSKRSSSSLEQQEQLEAIEFEGEENVVEKKEKLEPLQIAVEKEKKEQQQHVPWWLHALWSLLALIVRELAFEGILELLLGVYLLHKLSLFERRMGTSTFASFVAVIFILSWTIAIAFRVLLGWHRADGPYSVIFALMLAFHRQVPVVAVVSNGQAQRLRFGSWMSLSVTNKSAMFAGGVLLAMSHLHKSILAAAIGIGCGALYFSPVLSLHTARPPPAIRAFCTRHLLPLLERNTPTSIVQIFAQPIQLWSNDVPTTTTSSLDHQHLYN